MKPIIIDSLQWGMEITDKTLIYLKLLFELEKRTRQKKIFQDFIFIDRIQWWMDGCHATYFMESQYYWLVTLSPQYFKY